MIDAIEDPWTDMLRNIAAGAGLALPDWFGGEAPPHYDVVDGETGEVKYTVDRRGTLHYASFPVEALEIE